MKRFVIFAGVGGAATLLQFALLAAFIETGLANPIISSALSYGLSAIFNYLANYHLTFASRASHKQTFPKFALTACLGLSISTGIFALALSLLDNYLVAQCIATALTLIINFAIHKFWIYRSH